MGAFVETVLPKGEKTIGLKWVYDIKTDAAGVHIPGKEKARLVAQGFHQRPGQSAFLANNTRCIRKDGTRKLPD